MKKTSTKFFTLVALAALAFGMASCSNSSDGGAALPSLVATTTNNGGTSGAPNSDNTGGQPNGGSGGASAEANIFAGKTFSRKDIGGSIQAYTCKFDAQKCTFTRLVDFNIPGALTTAPASEFVFNYEYSYNKEKRLLFLKPSAEGHYEEAHVKNGVRTIEPDAFSNDAEFVAFVKKIYDTDDAQLINPNRVTFFYQYGYSDNTGAAEVSNEILEKYKAAKLEEKTRRAKLCTIMAYELSGQTLKMAQDSRVPKGKNLNEIFGVYDVQLPIASSNYTLRYTKNYYTLGPDIVEINNLSGNTYYKVDSITENAINISATATNSMNLSAGTGVWTYTPASQSFSYTTSKTETGATFTIDTLGTITVTYESENNFPDLTANFLDGYFGGVYTQQQ